MVKKVVMPAAGQTTDEATVTKLLVKVGDSVKCGDKIANVGDSAVFELAEEPHLHFELKVNGISVNPLDYFTDESKEASLGITGGSEK